MRFIWTITALLTLLLSATLPEMALSAQSAPQPNVIIVSIDGLQARHLRSHGYPLAVTPNLDRFLAKAYLFDRTVSPAPWTVPAHMSIFTSWYPSEHRVVNKFVEFSADEKNPKAVMANLQKLAPGAVTLAEILKKNGYVTAGFTGDAGVSGVFGSSQGFDEFYDKTVFGGFDKSLPMALDWLKKNQDKRFFLFLHGYDVHGQYAPAGGFDYRFVKKPYQGKYTGSIKEQAALREEGLAGTGPKLTAEDTAFWRAIYDEKIARADEQFGLFLDYLDKNRLLDNSIVVVLSDHGTEFLEHGKFDHGHSLYGELLDVLLAVHLPGQDQGKKLGSLVSTLDVTPTILGALRIQDPAQTAMKGIDLTPAIRGAEVSRDIFFETDFRLYTHKRGIQTPDGWKMVLTMENLNRELYNLKTDPGEKVNLAAREPQVTYTLEQKIYRHLKDMKANEGPWSLGCLPVYGDQCKPLAKPAPRETTLTTPLKRPNIVLINIDTLRAQQMGVYGYDKNTTPFLDSLFRQGVMFNNAITPAYLTFQTDAAILSGLYPSQNNVMTWLTPINEKLNLLPYILKLNGYKTAAFVSPSLWPSFQLDRQFDEYHLNKNLKNIAETKVSVANWMTGATGPFFLFWHVYDAHIPFMKPTEEFFSGEYSGTFLDEKQWDFVNQTTHEVRAQAQAKGPATAQLKEQDVKYIQAAYNTGIRYVDSQLRDFFASIRDKEFFKNTLFIISSEHGEDLKEHGFVFHRDLYDVNVRVPLALVGLPLEPKMIHEAVSSLDIMPTVVDIVGGVMPENIEGKSLVPLINGKSLDRAIYTERPPFDEYAMRRGQWKYIMRNPAKISQPAFIATIEDNFMKKIAGGESSAGDELYDLAADGRELNNLSGKGLPVETQMKAELEKFRARMSRARENNKGMNKTFPPGGPLIPYP